MVDLDVLHECDHFLLQRDQLLEAEIGLDECKLLEELFGDLVLVEECTNDSQVILLYTLYFLSLAFLLLLLLLQFFFFYLLELLVVLRFGRCEELL